ncbi:MAG: PAS domain-containing protein, partial [Oscillochloris sp.]|nr:PAS domain-containing protein [Oscillochloris sp.]
MTRHLRLSLGYSIAILIVVLLSGALISRQIGEHRRQQIALLSLHEQSLLQHALIHESEVSLVKLAQTDAHLADPTTRATFDRAAATLHTSANLLQLQNAFPEAIRLSTAIIDLEQAAQAVSAEQIGFDRLLKAQAAVEECLSAYSYAQEAHMRALSDIGSSQRATTTIYSIVVALATLAAIAGVIYTFHYALTLPLRLLSVGLAAIGRGDLDHQLPSTLPVEFHPIIQGYDQLRQVLHDRQDALTIQLRRTSLLTQISIELRGTLSQRVIAERVLRVLGSNLPIDQATIILNLVGSPSPIGLRLEHKRLSSLDDQRISQMLSHGLEGYVQQQGGSIVLTDVGHSERWLASSSYNEGSVIVLAIRQDTLTFGSLTIYTHQPQAFTNHDLLLMEGIVAQTSMAISLSLRFQSERQQRDQAIALLEMSRDELQRSRDLLRIVFDHLPEGLTLLDAQGRILAANNAFCRGIVGQPPKSIVSKGYHQLWIDLSQQSELSLIPQGPSESGIPLVPVDNEPFPVIAATWRVLCTDIVGQERWYAVDRIPINQASGQAEQCLERWRDITHQEALQRRLLVHEQLTSLGRLAASVAHEVGNPLQSALGCLDLCRTDTGIGETTREYLDLALGELDRMSRTMASLRNLYRPPQISWEQVDLNQLLRQVGQFTQRQLERAHVHMDFDLAERLPPISGQPDALRQVFLNLILNAQEAMPRGGGIHIHTTRKAT